MKEEDPNYRNHYSIVEMTLLVRVGTYFLPKLISDFLKNVSSIDPETGLFRVTDDFELILRHSVKKGTLRVKG